jgi:uncharacterized protein
MLKSDAGRRFEWDEKKKRENLRKHGVLFETATLVFGDPDAITRRDEAFEDEERWITLGAVGATLVLVVVHAYRDDDNQEVIRIISARLASPRERRKYGEANEGTEA